MQNLSPSKSLGFVLQDVARLLRRAMDHRAQDLGLTSAQWRILAYVARAERLSEPAPNQAALADLLDIEPISLSRQIDRAEAAGLIERRPDPNDRRAHRLYLTATARPLIESFRTVGMEVIGKAFAGVSEAEIAHVTDVLARVRANLTARPDAERALERSLS